MNIQVRSVWALASAIVPRCVLLFPGSVQWNKVSGMFSWTPALASFLTVFTESPKCPWQFGEVIINAAPYGLIPNITSKVILCLYEKQFSNSPDKCLDEWDLYNT